VRRDNFKHELLSGRRFFAEFLGLPEPDAASVQTGFEDQQHHRALSPAEAPQQSGISYQLSAVG